MEIARSMKQERERLDMWLEKDREMWIKGYTKIADRGIGGEGKR